MPKTSIRQSEVARYLKAARDAGYDSARIEIEKPDGTRVSVVVGKATETAVPGDDIDAMIDRVPNAIP